MRFFRKKTTLEALRDRTERISELIAKRVPEEVADCAVDGVSKVIKLKPMLPTPVRGPNLTLAAEKGEPIAVALASAREKRRQETTFH